MTLSTTLLAAFLSGCDTPPAQTQTVQAEAPVAQAPKAKARPAVDTDDDSPTRAELAEQLEAIDDRLSRLELVVAELQQVGIGEAERVRYNPARAGLRSQTVQAALDEVAGEIKRLRNAGSNMGNAGEGLFAPPPEFNPQPVNPGDLQEGQQGGPQPGGQPQQGGGGW